jgi:acyl-CoA reductase-like NAD-dependent aldehyde dehydrogenase
VTPLPSPPANSWDLWLTVPYNPDLASLLEPKSGSPTRTATTREHADEREHHPGGRARHGPPATGSDDVVGAIDTLVANAMKALQAYGTFSKEGVDHLVKKASVAALNQHGELATLAVAETGRGVFEDKAVKNIFACEHVTHSMANMKTVGVISEDPITGITEIAHLPPA